MTEKSCSEEYSNREWFKINWNIGRDQNNYKVYAFLVQFPNFQLEGFEVFKMVKIFKNQNLHVGLSDMFIVENSTGGDVL